VRASDHAGSRIELRGGIALERLADGTIEEWALDPCYDRLISTSGTFEEFPWCRTDGADDRPVHASTAGKWLLFPSCSAAASQWAAIAAEIARGGLWHAKVSLTNSAPAKPGHVVCVYTRDAGDAAQLLRAGQRLQALGLTPANGAIFYKPDLFTEQERYSGAAAASIFGLRSGSGFLFKTAGFKALPAEMQARLEETLAGLQ